MAIAQIKKVRVTALVGVTLTANPVSNAQLLVAASVVSNLRFADPGGGTSNRWSCTNTDSTIENLTSVTSGVTTTFATTTGASVNADSVRFYNFTPSGNDIRVEFLDVSDVVMADYIVPVGAGQTTTIAFSIPGPPAAFWTAYRGTYETA